MCKTKKIQVLVHTPSSLATASNYNSFKRITHGFEMKLAEDQQTFSQLSRTL